MCRNAALFSQQWIPPHQLPQPPARKRERTRSPSGTWTLDVLGVVLLALDPWPLNVVGVVHVLQRCRLCGMDLAHRKGFRRYSGRWDTSNSLLLFDVELGHCQVGRQPRGSLLSWTMILRDKECEKNNAMSYSKGAAEDKDLVLFMQLP